MNQGLKYQIDFKGMTSEGDFRKMALATAKLQKISPNEALEKIKTKHFKLIENLNSEKSEKLYKLLRSYGANVTLRPMNSSEKGEDFKINVKSRLSIHAVFLTIFIFILSATILIVMGKLLDPVEIGPGGNGIVKRVKESIVGPKIYKSNDYITEAVRVIENAKQRLQKEGWKSNPRSPNNGFLSVEEFNQGLKYLQEATLKDPQDERVEQWKAQLFELNGDKNKADENYRLGLTKNPQNVYLRNDYAAFLTQEELYKKAEFQYRKAIEVDPKNPESHKNIGALYQFYLDDSTKAKSHYYKYAMNSSPKDVQRYLVLKELSLITWAQNHTSKYPAKNKSNLGYADFEPQRSSLERKISLEPKNEKLYLAQGILFAQKGMHEAALLSLKKAEKLKKSNDVFYEKAGINMALENIEQAYRELNKGDLDLADAEYIASLALLEKFYKLDTAKTESLLKRYLKVGGRDEVFLKDILLKEE